MTIYLPTGASIIDAPVLTSATIYNTLMADHYIELEFEHNEILDLPKGIYVLYKGRKYETLSKHIPESTNIGYKYTIQFYAQQHQMQLCRLFWLAGAQREVTFQDTTTLASFAQLIADNMNAFQGVEKWVVGSIPDEYAEPKKLVSFDGTSCWDAIKDIASTFECEWWVEDNISQITLNFGKCENGDYAIFAEGDVVSQFPAPTRGVDTLYGTRFFVFGGTRNIPEDYYDAEIGGETNHISEKRLHLPSGIEYIDAFADMKQSEVVEQVVILEDVFPKNEETVTSVEIVKREIIEGEQNDVYVMYCADTPFIPNDDTILDTLGVTFTSGSLQGREFEISVKKNNWDKKFEIIAQTENAGGGTPLIIPNKDLCPKAGDTFILTGVKLPDDRVRDAEDELLGKGREIAIKRSHDTNVYECPTNAVYCANNGCNYELGQKVLLRGNRFGALGRQSRIQGYQKKLWNEFEAVYTVGDNSIYTRYGIVRDELKTQSKTLNGRITTATNKATKAAGKASQAKVAVTTIEGRVYTLETDFENVETIASEAGTRAAATAVENDPRIIKASADAASAVQSANEANARVDSLLEDSDDITLKGIKTQLEAIEAKNNAQDDAIGDKASKSDVGGLSDILLTVTADVATLKSGKADKTDVTALAKRVTTNEGAIANKAEQSEVNELSNDVANLAKEVATNLNNKVDKITGKGLSTEDFTTALKTRLENLSNYDDTAVNAAIAGLQTQLNTLVQGNADGAINKFNEIIAFLEGIEDSEDNDLKSIIASIEQQIAGKQDAISDLSTIRSNANAGAEAKTAVDALEPRVTTVEGDVATAQENIERNTEQIGGIVKQVQSLTTRVGTAEADIDNIEGEINDINAQIATKADAEAVETRFSGIETRVGNKVDKVAGKGLSTNDYTTTEKNKLAGIAEGAEVNVQSDWNATSGDAFIKNKPSIPTKISELTDDSNFATTDEVTTMVQDKADEIQAKVSERVTPIEEDVAEALKKANEADTNANTALSRATTAINTAEAAQNTANQKLDEDDVTADIVKPMATGAALSDVSESGVLSAKIDYLRGNRLAFLDPSEYTIEKKIGADGAWETLDSTTEKNRGLFAGLLWNTGINVGSEFSIGSQVRITIHLANTLRKGIVEYVAVRVFENGRIFNAKLEYASNLTNPTWEEVNNKDIRTPAWGPTYILQYNKLLSQGYGLRITLTAINDKTVGSAILGIGAYGTRIDSATAVTAPYAMARLGHLYSWDYLQNVEFPNQVKAKSIYATDSITSAGNISAVGKISATGSLSCYSLALTSGSKNALLYSDGSPVQTSTLSFGSNQIRKIQSFTYVKNDVWPVPAAQIGVYRANRLAFLSDDEFKVEMSTDSGATWVEQAKTDNLRKLFCGMNSGYVSMASKPTNQMRITLTPTGSRYTYIEWFYLYFGGPYAADPPVRLKCEYAIGNAPDTWILYRDNIPLEGQNGPNMFYFGQMIAHGSTLPKNVRFTITCSVESTTITRIFGIEGHGRSSISTNAMANWDHLYTTNPSQDAIFPAKVQGVDFVYADGSTVSDYVRGKIDEVNANIAKKLPLPSVTNLEGNIMTWDSETGRVSDTGKFFSTSLQDFDYNEPDAIPNCDLVQQYVAQSIPTEIATAPQKETPYGQRVTIFPNRVHHINEGQTTTGTEIININTTGANAGYDNIWKARLSVGMGIGTTSLVFLVDSIETNIKWKDGVAPTYQSTGGELELTFVQFGGLWLGEWKLFN